MKSFLYNKSFWMKFQKRLTAKVQPSVIEANGKKKKLIYFTQHTKDGFKLEKQKTPKTYFPQRSHILIAGMKIK